tara:strand:+ start:58 stop:867 length:810 start_codon:yes stop_codon:yes gene_type:complete
MKAVLKIKWLIKKAYLYIIFYKKNIKAKSRSPQEVYDFDFLNAVFENNKLIKSNIDTYNNLDLSYIKKHNLDHITKTSIQNSKNLVNSINNEYFSNLNEYGYGRKILDYENYNELEFIDKFHLYPANVFVINEILKLQENEEIQNGLIVDYPSGIGNLLFYLSKFFPTENLIGIDDFSQISKEDIEDYQKSTSVIEINKYEDTDFRDVDVLVSIELTLDVIIENILKLNSKYLIFETMYVSRFNDIQKALRSSYVVDSINESVVVYRLK